jgi:hypothetical protein
MYVQVRKVTLVFLHLKCWGDYFERFQNKFGEKLAKFGEKLPNFGEKLPKFGEKLASK